MKRIAAIQVFDFKNVKRVNWNLKIMKITHMEVF